MIGIMMMIIIMIILIIIIMIIGFGLQQNRSQRFGNINFHYISNIFC